MATWIAMLRGGNVGGKNILQMAELRSALGELGLTNVRTCHPERERRFRLPGQVGIVTLHEYFKPNRTNLLLSTRAHRAQPPAARGRG